MRLVVLSISLLESLISKLILVIGIFLLLVSIPFQIIYEYLIGKKRRRKWQKRNQRLWTDGTWWE